MDTHKTPGPTSKGYFCPKAHHYSLLVLLTTLLAFTKPAIAESPLYKHRSPDGTMMFSDAPMVDGQIVRISYSNQYGRQMATNSCSGLTTQQLDARGLIYQAAIQQVANTTSLEPHWIMAVARVESCFDAKAVSRVGAEGLMQLMPATAKDVGVSNSHDPMQNLRGGARYLDRMMDQFNDMDLALAAYNAGPGTVTKYKGIPPYPETQRYVEQVTQFAKKYKPLFARSP